MSEGSFTEAYLREASNQNKTGNASAKEERWCSGTAVREPLLKRANHKPSPSREICIYLYHLLWLAAASSQPTSTKHEPFQTWQNLSNYPDLQTFVTERREQGLFLWASKFGCCCCYNCCSPFLSSCSSSLVWLLKVKMETGPHAAWAMPQVNQHYQPLFITSPTTKPCACPATDEASLLVSKAMARAPGLPIMISLAAVNPSG